MPEPGAVAAGTVAILPVTAGPRDRAQAGDLSVAFAGNTGNMVFEEALQALCPAAWLARTDDLQVIAGHDHIIVSLANAISDHPCSDGLIRFAAQLARIRRLSPSTRFVVTAIGAQYPAFDAAPTIEPARLRLVRDLAESAPYIGVRGHFTAELLHQHGVRNTWVVGDPALLHPRIGATAPAPAIGGDLIVGWTPSGSYRDVYRCFLDWSRRHDAVLVAQSAQERLLPVPGQRAVTAGSDLAAILDYYSWPAVPHDDLAAWMVRRGTWFAHPEDWYQAMSGQRLALGTRFHGNAAAAIAGTPALQLTMDTRTAELAAFHGLASMPLQEFDPRLGPADYLARAVHRSVHQRVAVLRANLYAFWRAVGLEVDPVGAVTPPPAPARPPEERAGLRLGERYVLRALEHALAPDGGFRFTQAQAQAALQVIGTPRGLGLGQLVDAAPGLLFATRQAGLEALAERVAGPLGVPV